MAVDDQVAKFVGDDVVDATGDINAKVFASKNLTELPNANAPRTELITTQETISRRLDERKPLQ